MDTRTILSLPKHHRATFIALMIALFLIVLLIDWHFSSLTFIESTLGYLRSVGAAILTTLFVLWVLVSFFPSTAKAGLAEVEARRITKEFENLLSEASRWRYKGNFGRYMRGKVLPTLAGRQNVHVSACVIDPANASLCEKHARYRSQINSIDKGQLYDADRVALEVIVTIVISAWYVRNRRIAIELYLCPFFDPVRIDSNDQAMILTVEDRRSPALKVTREHFTYEHFELQMEHARKQSRQVRLEGMREGIQLAEINEEDVVSVLRSAELDDLCERLAAETIVQACRAAKNPYEN